MNTREIKWLGQGVDDPCATLQQQVNNQQAFLNQLKATKVEVQANVVAASQSGDPAAIAQANAELAQINSAITAATGNLNSLKQLLANCKSLAPGCDPNTPCPTGLVCVNGKCVQPGTPVPPPCSATNPCPAGQTCVNGTCVSPPPPAAKKASSGLGLLLLGGAAAAGVLFLGPAIFGKGGINKAMARADAARLQSNRRRGGYAANRRRRY